MFATWAKRIAGLVVVLLLVAVVVYALVPRPVAVDLATIARGPMEVTIDQEGISRVRNVYQVSAPVTGKLRRPEIEPGDPVVAGETVVATLRPVDPALLDARTHQELTAAADAASAAVAAAQAQVENAVQAVTLAEADHARAVPLAASGTITEREMDRLVNAVNVARAGLLEARAMLQARQSDLESAQARLIDPGQELGADGQPALVEVRAPVSGVVLSVLVESEQVVPAGTPLLSIGDLADSEIAVDLLSSDAVQVAPGAEARIEDWGGEGSLSARLRRIDPAAFTKVSALGIEEQRVNAVLDITAPYEQWQRLGHDFRVMVRITVWKGDDVVTVPLGALFRAGGGWAVFKVSDGVARLQPVDVGHTNRKEAEVLGGLAPDDSVVLHPSDQIQDGTSVTDRRIE